MADRKPDPESVLSLNRDHWRIEIMRRDGDVTLDEDNCTNRVDHAPATSSRFPTPRVPCPGASPPRRQGPSG